MPPTSPHTGFAQGRRGGYGRIYDQTASLANEADNENQEEKEAVEGCFNEISLIG